MWSLVNAEINIVHAYRDLMQLTLPYLESFLDCRVGNLIKLKIPIHSAGSNLHSLNRIANTCPKNGSTFHWRSFQVLRYKSIN